MRVALAVGVLLSTSGSVLAQEPGPGEGAGVGGEHSAGAGVTLAMWAGLSVVALVAAWRAGWFARGAFTGNRDPGQRPWWFWLLLMPIGAFFAQAVMAGFIQAGVAEQGELVRTSAASLGVLAGTLFALGCAFAPSRAGENTLRPGCGLRASSQDLWIGALVCAGAIPLVSLAALVASLIATLSGEEPETLRHSTLRLLAENESAWAFWLTVFAVVVAAPVAEEIVFRGFIQTGLAQAGLGPVGGVVGASLAFLAVHATVLDGEMMPALFVLSVILGLSYERIGRIGTPIVAHACFNAFNLWVSGVAGGAA